MRYLCFSAFLICMSVMTSCIEKAPKGVDAVANNRNMPGQNQAKGVFTSNNGADSQNSNSSSSLLKAKQGKLLNVSANGDVYTIVSTDDQKDIVAKWDGSAWRYFPGQNTKQIHIDARGTLYSIRDMGEQKDLISKWVEEKWQYLPGQGNEKITSSPNGDIYTIRDMGKQKNLIAKWDGSAWQFLPGQGNIDIKASNNGNILKGRQQKLLR